jgi:DNA-directed RNA polymerase specialized sigma24 family protein
MQPPNPQAQFDSWWRPNEARFLAYARRQAGGDLTVAEDATQETGRYIWGRWADYQPGPGDAIVFTILRSRVIDQLRRRGGLVFSGAETLEATQEESPDEEVALRETLRDHQACVDELPDSSRAHTGSSLVASGRSE